MFLNALVLVYSFRTGRFEVLCLCGTEPREGEIFKSSELQIKGVSLEIQSNIFLDHLNFALSLKDFLILGKIWLFKANISK